MEIRTDQGETPRTERRTRRAIRSRRRAPTAGSTSDGTAGGAAGRAPGSGEGPAVRTAAGDDGAAPDTADTVDGELVTRALEGDPDAFGELYLRWFDPVYEMARRMLRNPDLAAEVAQEVFLNGWRSLSQLRDPAAVGGWLLCSARNRALNLIERERRSVTVDLEAPPDSPRATTGVPWERLAVATDPTDALADAEVASLVWESAEALGARDLSLLDLHLRHGLTPGEIAEQIEVEPNAAHQMLHRLRRRLKTAVEARVLWRDGTPACARLADLVTASEATVFDASTVRLIDDHAKECAECTRRRRTKLAPADLFSSASAAAAPISAVTRVAEALAAQGVPMGRVLRDLRRRLRRRGVRNHRVAAVAVAAVTVLGVVVLGWGTVGEPDVTEIAQGSGRGGTESAGEPGATGGTPGALGAAADSSDGPSTSVGEGGGDPAANGDSETSSGATGAPSTTTGGPAPTVGGGGPTGSSAGATPTGAGSTGGGSTGGSSSGGTDAGGASGSAGAATTTVAETIAPPADPDPPYIKHVDVSPKSCGKGGAVSVSATYGAPAGVSGWSGTWSSSDGGSSGSVGLTDGSGGFTLTQDATGLKVYVEVTVTDSLGRSASGSGVGYC